MPRPGRRHNDCTGERIAVSDARHIHPIRLQTRIPYHAVSGYSETRTQSRGVSFSRKVSSVNQNGTVHEISFSFAGGYLRACDLQLRMQSTRAAWLVRGNEERKST